MEVFSSKVKKELWILDDEEIVHYLIEGVLDQIETDEEIVVKNFYSAISILPKLSKKLPDILLLDINLKGLNGLELINLISENKEMKKVDIYVLSASIDPQDLFFSINSELVKNFISKPITKSKLEEILKND